MGEITLVSKCFSRRKVSSDQAHKDCLATPGRQAKGVSQPPEPCQPAPPGANLLLASIGVLSGQPCPRHPEPCKPGPRAEREVCVRVCVSESGPCLCLHQKDLSNQLLADFRNRAVRRLPAAAPSSAPAGWGLVPKPCGGWGNGRGFLRVPTARRVVTTVPTAPPCAHFFIHI